MAKVLIAGIGGGKDIASTPREANQTKTYIS